MNVYRKEVFGFSEHVAYYITPRFHAYGIVNSGDMRIVIGPTAQIFAEERELNELAFEAGVPMEETRAFIEGIKSITTMPLESLITML
ncbi:MAG: hypothetical protein IKS88_01595, partial [Clostridia bacterium]|nr:hypothetical protein [Clostridia bacterium]